MSFYEPKCPCGFNCRSLFVKSVTVQGDNVFCEFLGREEPMITDGATCKCKRKQKGARNDRLQD